MKHKGKTKSPVVQNKSTLEDVIGFIDSNSIEFIKTLKEIIEIDSSSSNPWKRLDLTVMVKWCIRTLRSLGAEVEECHSPYEFQDDDNNNLNCPPVLLATYGKDPTKKTVCIYHYLDVPSPRQNPSAGTTISGKYMTAPEVANHKGPLLQWVAMVQAHQAIGLPLPVNLKFIWDPYGLTEVSRLIEILHENKQKFLQNIDYYFTYSFCGLKYRIPSIVYGLRGVCLFYLRIFTENQNEKSSVNSDVIYMLDNIIDSSGEITIDDLLIDVPEMNSDEIDWFNMMPIDPKTIKEESLINHLWSMDKASFLSKIWRFPAISFHSFNEKIIRTDLSSPSSYEVTACFSVRTVPLQTPRHVRGVVLNYLARKWDDRNSENNMVIGMNYWAWPWRADQFDENYKFITEAIIEVHGENPPQILDGTSLPFAGIIRLLVDKNVVILSSASFSDASFTDNEKYSIRNFINGIKVVTHYVHKIQHP